MKHKGTLEDGLLDETGKMISTNVFLRKVPYNILNFMSSRSIHRNEKQKEKIIIQPLSAYRVLLTLLTLSVIWENNLVKYTKKIRPYLVVNIESNWWFAKPRSLGEF